MKIIIQSLVDVITNSSTTIYQTANEDSIYYMKNIINGILLAAGSDKKADDLFDFSIHINDIYTYKEFLYERGCITEEVFNDDSINTIEKILEKIIKEIPDYPGEINFNSYIKITTKDNNKEANKLLGIIEDIYYHYETFDY